MPFSKKNIEKSRMNFAKNGWQKWVAGRFSGPVRGDQTDRKRESTTQSRNFYDLFQYSNDKQKRVAGANDPDHRKAWPVDLETLPLHLGPACHPFSEVGACLPPIFGRIHRCATCSWECRTHAARTQTAQNKWHTPKNTTKHNAVPLKTKLAKAPNAP